MITIKIICNLVRHSTNQNKKSYVYMNEQSTVCKKMVY